MSFKTKGERSNPFGKGRSNQFKSNRCNASVIWHFRSFQCHCIANFDAAWLAPITQSSVSVRRSRRQKAKQTGTRSIPQNSRWRLVRASKCKSTHWARGKRKNRARDWTNACFADSHRPTRAHRPYSKTAHQFTRDSIGRIRNSNDSTEKRLCFDD